MYDHLFGEVAETRPARVVLLVGGIGFDLMVPTTTSERLKGGETAQLFTIHHVTETQHSLLGFRRRSERDLARRLMSVSGVGPSIALAILSMYTAEHIAQALMDEDHQLLQKVKGVGQRTAERLCLELRDAVAKLDLGKPSDPARAVTLLPKSSEDAVAALMTLGYTEKEATKKVTRHHDKAPDASTEELIKAVLRS